MLPIDKDKKELGRGFHCYWSELPLDLKVEILCRLPHKPLIRLKCVSKSWYFLISNQCVPKISTSVFCGVISTIHVPEDSFSYLHFDSDDDYSLHSPQVRLQNAITNVLRIILPFKHEAQELQDCCNGLMLLARFVSSSIPTQYYVCNPITYECITIPVHLNHLKQEDSCVSSLVFDPNYPSSFMIINRREYSQYLLKIDIFSSTSGNWSSHVVPLDHALDGFKLIDRAIYLNGVIYMLSLAKYLICIYLPVDEANSESISSRAIALPGKDEFDSRGAFGVSGGNLVYSNSGNSETLVWMLQGCIRWVLKHRIKHAEFINQFSPARYNWYHKHSNCRPMKVYAFHPNSEEIIMGSPVMLLKYNPKTKHVQIYHTWPSSGSRYISRGQQKVFPLSRCPVILRSVIKNQ